MEINGLSDKRLVFVVKDKHGQTTEVSDMYFFEENGIHNNNDASNIDYDSMKITGIRFEQTFSI